MQATDPGSAVQATQLAIKHAVSGQAGPVAVLFSQDSLAGMMGPDSVPVLYPTRHYLPPPPAEPSLVAAASATMAEADLVLAIGTKLGPSDTAWENRKLLDPTPQTFIQIDIEPRNASWTFPAEHVLLGAAAVALRQLVKAAGMRGESGARRRNGVLRRGGGRWAILMRRNITWTSNRSCRSG